eukprot:TRINITY_DN3367_c0_g1_i4.p1 TRINITY_DN3367_c0_g1~~TRINITY_DN3367_c0_g1_i4.p1  ORF type:complete len:337 (+),score=68.68 TRINITY_DN3367_c0_g1_i4:69-1079(+)
MCIRDRENIDPVSRNPISSLPFDKSLPVSRNTPRICQTYKLPASDSLKQSACSLATGTSSSRAARCRVFGSCSENGAKADADEKYKTELCKNWILCGRCSYGGKCRFAHGPNDLVNKQIYNPKYKSKKCEAFHNALYCPYGVRCNFIHDEGSTSKRRRLYYTYLLDPQIKLSTAKYALVKYLEELFSVASDGGNDTQGVLFDKLVDYIKNGKYFRRLPVFARLAEGEKRHEESKSASSKPLLMLQEILERLVHDYEEYKEEKDYKNALELFILLLVKLHPDLKAADYFRLEPCTSIALLEALHNSLVLQPPSKIGEEFVSSFDTGMIMGSGYGAYY